MTQDKQATDQQLRRAMDLQLRAVQTSRRTKGDLHTATLQLVNELLMTVQRAREFAVRQEAGPGFTQSQLSEMRALFEEIYETAVQEQGINAEVSRWLANVVAEALLMEGNVAGAEKLHRQILDMNTKAAGRDDEYTLLSMSNLAGVLYQQGKYKEARDLSSEEVSIRTRVNGPEALETMEALKRLALTLNGLRSPEEEAAVRRQILSICLKQHGTENTATTEAAWYLVRLLRYTGPEKDLVEVLQNCLLWLGPADINKLTSRQRGIREELRRWLQAGSEAQAAGS